MKSYSTNFGDKIEKMNSSVMSYFAELFRFSIIFFSLVRLARF